MNYISEIFDWLDMQNICGFLLYGAEDCEISDKTYEQRLNKAQNAITKYIKERFPEESEKILNEIFHYGNTERLFIWKVEFNVEL